MSTCGCWLQDVVKSSGSLQGSCSLHSKEAQRHHTSIAHECSREWEKCTYSLTLRASLYVCQADILNDSLLTVVQVLSLGQQDALGLCVLTDDVVGLAHTLYTKLVAKKKNKLINFGILSFC